MEDIIIATIPALLYGYIGHKIKADKVKGEV